MEKTAFIVKNTFFPGKLGLNLKTRLVNCCIWSGAGPWHSGKVTRNSWKVLKCAGEGWRRSFGRTM
jgi:hypothetical protein